jgi:flavin-dependent trigonelline monooxygenase, reductase component
VPIDPSELRNTLSHFLTGVTIVTTRDHQNIPRGFTANSFTSVSLDPPLILACLANNASSFDAFDTCTQFAVNILADDQRELSNTFASKRKANKFEGARLLDRERTAPVVDGALAWLDCDIQQRIPAGDHVILIGRVVDHGQAERYPLGFFAGNYLDLSLGRCKNSRAQFQHSKRYL